MVSQVSIREITRENWRETLALSVHPDQQRFIANYAPIAAIVLAKAYIRPGGLVWQPYAFYADQCIVGLIALAYEPNSSDGYWIYHFFIDQAYQGQGYGKAALHAFIQNVREQHAACQNISLTVHPENSRAQHLYTNMGFRSTGAEVDGEAVYKLRVIR